MNSVKAFVIDELQKEYDFPTDIDIDSLDYVASGYISSLGIIQFLMNIEYEFNITFTEEELASPEIRVVGKLVTLIEKKILT